MKKELKHIISSVVRKLITEEMHVINSSLFKLAFFIITTARKPTGFSRGRNCG